MWVDIFPLDADTYIPPGVDITPRKLEEYELRVIIWDVQGLRLDDHGKKVSDIYVRALVYCDNFRCYLLSTLYCLRA